jgi:hypothetical protein
MNIIKTVGDLKKAMSIYDDDLPVEICMIDGSARTAPVLYRVTRQLYDKDRRNIGHEASCLVISAVKRCG